MDKEGGSKTPVMIHRGAEAKGKEEENDSKRNSNSIYSGLSYTEWENISTVKPGGGGEDLGGRGGQGRGGFSGVTSQEQIKVLA